MTSSMKTVVYKTKLIKGTEVAGGVIVLIKDISSMLEVLLMGEGNFSISLWPSKHPCCMLLSLALAGSLNLLRKRSPKDKWDFSFRVWGGAGVRKQGTVLQVRQTLVRRASYSACRLFVLDWPTCFCISPVLWTYLILDISLKCHWVLELGRSLSSHQ